MIEQAELPAGSSVAQQSRQALEEMQVDQNDQVDENQVQQQNIQQENQVQQEDQQVAVKRRKVTQKHFIVDRDTTIPLRQVFDWRDGYVARQAEVKAKREARRSRRAAHQRAAYKLVFGDGINGVGRDIVNPDLAEFCGAQLERTMLGEVSGPIDDSASEDSDGEDPFAETPAERGRRMASLEHQARLKQARAEKARTDPGAPEEYSSIIPGNKMASSSVLGQTHLDTPTGPHGPGLGDIERVTVAHGSSSPLPGGFDFGMDAADFAMDEPSPAAGCSSQTLGSLPSRPGPRGTDLAEQVEHKQVRAEEHAVEETRRFYLEAKELARSLGQPQVSDDGVARSWLDFDDLLDADELGPLPGQKAEAAHAFMQLLTLATEGHIEVLQPIFVSGPRGAMIPGPITFGIPEGEGEGEEEE